MYSQQKLAVYLWEWILKMMDLGEKDIKLDKGEFIHMGTLFNDSVFHSVARAPEK